MRSIIKQIEPGELTEYRLKPDATYEDAPGKVKDAIRAQLLSEQGHLCAYCMDRLHAGDMKIEHWQSQAKNKYPERQLDYKNMLACCKGGELKGSGMEGHTCDTRKGDLDLKYSPAVAAHKIESRIRFPGNGSIESDEPDFNKQLENVLNLNYARLVENRKAVLKNIQDILGQKTGRRTKTEIGNFINRFSTPNGKDELPPYTGVILYDLNKRHKRAL